MRVHWEAIVLLPFAAACASPPAEPRLHASGCYRTGKDGTIFPQPVKTVAPDYPQSAYDANLSGWVALEGSIGIDGGVDDAVIVQSQPPGVFDTAALVAFEQFEYCPPADHLPYPDRFQIVLRFQRNP